MTDNTTKHTPGPWDISQGYIWASARKVANLSDGTAFEGAWTDPEQNANASLIAASPDLLAALRAVLPLAQEAMAARRHGGDPDDAATLAMFEADMAAAVGAIAKAEGRQP